MGAGIVPALRTPAPEGALPSPEVLEYDAEGMPRARKGAKALVQDFQPLIEVAPGGFDSQVRSLNIIADQRAAEDRAVDLREAEGRALHEAAKRNVSFQDAYLAGASNSNAIVAWATLMHEKDVAKLVAPSPIGFKPEDHIKGFEEWAGFLLDAESPEDLVLRKAEITRQLEQNAQLSLGGGSGVVGSIAGSLASPFTLALAILPLGLFVRAGKTAETVARTVGGSVAATLPEEAILHQLQPLRTKEETIFNVVSSAIVDGSLGAWLSRLSKAEIEAAKAGMDAHLKTGRAAYGGQVTADEVAAMAGGGAAMAAPEATGAALKAARGIMASIGIPGTKYNLAELVFWTAAHQSPKGRLLASSSVEVRRTAQMLMENPMHVEGDFSVTAVETIVKHDRAKHEIFMSDLAGLERAAGLSKDEFFRQVTDGLRSAMKGADTPNPQVADAIRRVERQFKDAWDHAFEARLPGTFIEKTDPATGAKTFTQVEQRTAEGYFTRIYDISKVRANPVEFRRDLKLAYEAQYAKERVELTEATAVPRRELGQGKVERQAARKAAEKTKSKVEKVQARISVLREQLGFARMKQDEPLVKLLKEKIDAQKVKRGVAKEAHAVKAAVVGEKEAAIVAVRNRLKELEDTMAPGRLPENDLAWSNFLDDYYNAVINLRPGDHFAGKGLPKPTKMRSNISDSSIRNWLADDLYGALDTYHNSLMPKVRTAETFGDWEMKEHMAKLTRDYNARREVRVAEGVSPKQIAKDDREFHARTRDIVGSRDIIQHRAYPIGLSPGQEMAVSALRTVRSYNVISKLGMVIGSTIPDFARATLRAAYSGVAGRSIMNQFAHVVSAFNADLKAGKLEAFKALGTGMHQDRLNRVATAIDYGMVARITSHSSDMDGPALSRAERASREASNFATKTFFLPQATMAYKSMVAHAAGQDIAEAMEKGAFSAKQQVFLKQHGINDEMMGRILAQKQHVRPDDGGVRNPGLELWTDIEAVEAVERAVIKHADTVVVTPSQTERPLWTTHGSFGEVGALMTQFMGYNMGAMYRLVIPNLQAPGVAPYIEGLAMMVGGLGSKLFRDGLPDLNDERKRAKFFFDVVDRSGMASYGVDMDRRMFRTFGASPLGLLGDRPPGRYYARSPLEVWGGPAAGTVAGVGRAGWQAIGENKDPDALMHSLRMLMPAQNHFLFRYGVDAMEREMAQLIGGTGEKAGPPHDPRR